MTAELIAPRHSRLRLPAVALGVMALAALVAGLGAPTAVRTLLVLPVVVGVAGAAILAAVLPGPAEIDRLTRSGMVLVLGVAALVVSALVDAAFSGPLRASRLIVVQLLITAVALAVWLFRTRGKEGASPNPLNALRAEGLRASAFASVLVGVLLVAAAVVAGRHVLPSAGAGSPVFSFTGAAATQQGPTVAAPGTPVSLPWALRHEDAGLPAGQSLQAVVDGRPVAVTSDVTPAGSGRWSGNAQVLAPTQPGVHRVILSLPLPDRRLELVSYVNVTG